MAMRVKRDKNLPRIGVKGLLRSLLICSLIFLHDAHQVKAQDIFFTGKMTVIAGTVDTGLRSRRPRLLPELPLKILSRPSSLCEENFGIHPKTW